MDIREVRDALSEAIHEQLKLDAAYKAAKAAWDEEMKPLIERQAEVNERVARLEEAAQDAIRSLAEAGDTEAVRAVIGFNVAQVRTIKYDEATMLKFARQHAPTLVVEKLANKTTISNWVKGQPASMDMETGEWVRVIPGDFGTVTIPVQEVTEWQPRIERTALNTLADEREFRATKDEA